MLVKSGVHATLAGVALAFTIPLNCKNRNGESCSLSKDMEKDLHFWVAFFILPLFAFVNAGVDLRNVSLDQMAAGVPLGIMAGLFLGKQIGVFGFSWIAIKLGLAKIPDKSTWLQLYGVSILTGIGFTMSLFIGGLAFSDAAMLNNVRLGVLAGSLASGLAGCALIFLAGQRASAAKAVRAKKNPSRGFRLSTAT